MEKYHDAPQAGATTNVAIARHPVHPMLVTFPIALLICALATDLAYWWHGDPFWARGSLWLVGTGTTVGLLAAVTGTAELLWEPAIRRRVAAWSHFVAAIVMLSVGAANWALRLAEGDDFIVPWGIATSSLTAAMVGIAGWFGGKLVFEHRIGVQDEEV